MSWRQCGREWNPVLVALVVVALVLLALTVRVWVATGLALVLLVARLLASENGSGDA